MTLREIAEKADREVKENPVKPIKKSAADIEALRWREMFQAAMSGCAARTFPNSMAPYQITEHAAQCADLGLREFHKRYRQEGT